MRIARKILSAILLKYIKLYDGINNEKYTKKYIKFLSKRGMKISKLVNYIHSTVSFDGTGYELISIGDYSVISRDVIILVHDFSVRTGALASKITFEECLNWHFKKEVYIGNNVFIGMGAIILPGTHISNNVIIGAGSVVRGYIEEDSVIIGNPAKKICSLKEWFKNKKNNTVIDKKIF